MTYMMGIRSLSYMIYESERGYSVASVKIIDVTWDDTSITLAEAAQANAGYIIFGT